MAQGRAVDGTDHRYFDIEQIQEELLAFPIGPVPIAGGAPQAPVRSGPRSRKGLTRTGHDHDFILRVAANIPKRLPKFAMRQFPPLQGATVGMKGDLQDALASFHTDSLVRLGVIIEACHGVSSLQRYDIAVMASTRPAIVCSVATISTRSQNSRAVAAVLGPMVTTRACAASACAVLCPTCSTKLRTVLLDVKVSTSTPVSIAARASGDGSARTVL